MVRAEVGETIVIDAHDHTLDQAFWGRSTWGKKKRLPLRERIDLPSLRSGGVTVGIFACCVIATSTQGGSSSARKHPLCTLLQMWDLFFQQLKTESGLVLATSAADIEEAKKGGKVAAILGMEGGDSIIEGDLGVLRMLYRLGLRHVLLVHEGRNALGTSSRFHIHNEKNWHWYNSKIDGPDGLTAAGKELVREMNRLGMIIDVSHLTEKSFWDVLNFTTEPVIASHSNSRSLNDCLRNLTDKQIVAIADKGGVVGVTGVPFRGPAEQRTRTIENVLADADHMVNLVGPDHIGLGTDYGRGCFLFPDKSTQKIIDVVPIMLKHGYSAEKIKKILGANFMRIIKKVLL